MIRRAAADASIRSQRGLPPVDYSGQDLTEPCQRAVLVHWRGRESLVLFVDYLGASDKFAWVIPCPSKLEVRKIASKTTRAIAFQQTSTPRMAAQYHG